MVLLSDFAMSCHLVEVSIGILVWILCWNISPAGDASVALCGVERYSLRNVLSVCFQGMLTISAAQMAFSSVRIKCSAVAFARGLRGVIFW